MMIDSFLEVAYGKTKTAEDMDRRVELMRKLPDGLLRKIASGEEKLGYPVDVTGSGDEPKIWLDRFKDTPLFEEALEIEKQELENRMADQQRRQEEQANWQARDSARDELCIKRKMLELQLAELESGGGESLEEEAAAEGEPPAEEAAEQAGGGETTVPEAAEQMKAAMAKAAAQMQKSAKTLREIEEETIRRGREAGGKWGLKRGARSGARAGAVPAALAGAIGGGLYGGLKGGGGRAQRALRALGGAAAGAAGGGGIGAAYGGGTGAYKGKRIGKQLGEQAAKQRNLQRRLLILRALRNRQMAQPYRTKQSSAELSKEAIGLWGAGKGLVSAMRTGWAGRGAAKNVVRKTMQAGKEVEQKGISGVSGALHHGGKYMGGLMRKSPGLAAGMIAAPAAGAGYALGS
jgi:hypothetical protein